MFLGAPGSNDPRLLPQTGIEKEGASGPPQRSASKKRPLAAVVHALEGNAGDADDNGQEALVVVEMPPLRASGSGSSNVCTPNAGTPSSVLREPVPDQGVKRQILQVLQNIEICMKNSMELMRMIIKRNRLGNSDKSLRLEVIKVKLAAFPPGSSGHTKALEDLETLSSMADQKESGDV